MSATRCRRTPAATSIPERRLLRAAAAGDPNAQQRLLARYEPMVRAIVAQLHVAGGERDDLAQEMRLSVLDAARRWDPARRVPFACFARLCARRQAGIAIAAAGALKHQPLTSAVPLDAPLRSGEPGEGIHPLRGSHVEVVAATHADGDPVAKVIAREELGAIIARVPTLSKLERAALGMSANDRPHAEIARALGVRPRGVNNALQRARHKLVAPVAA